MMTVYKFVIAILIKRFFFFKFHLAVSLSQSLIACWLASYNPIVIIHFNIITLLFSLTFNLIILLFMIDCSTQSD